MAFELSSHRRRLGHGDCAFCRRRVPLTFHHLIPKKLHRRRFFQQSFDSTTLARGIAICRDCHTGIHRCYDEMHLGTRLNTPALLYADPALRRHFRWVAKQRTAADG